MKDLVDYLELVTSYHRGKPRFTASLSASVQPMVDLQKIIGSLPAAFDLDTAVGEQLDRTGLWVGLTRLIPVPLPGIYFSWDTSDRGWDEAVWRGPYDSPVGISRLDDETFRRLLKSKVLANSWDSTVPKAQAILDVFFTDPDTHVFIQDAAISAFPGIFFAWDDPSRGWDVGIWYQEGLPAANISSFGMKMIVGVSGKWPSSTDLAILGRGMFGIKPEGVEVEYSVTSVDGASLFGFDLANDYVRGWDEGAWGVSPDYVLNHM